MDAPRPMPAPVPFSAVERFFQFSLLGMLASGYFAMASSGLLDPLAHVTGLLALALRGAIVIGLLRPPSGDRAPGMVTLASLLFFPIDYLYLSGSLSVAVLHLTFFLAGLKLVTATTGRDYGYLKAIAAMELLTAAMLGPGLSFFAYLALFLFFTIAAFSSGEIRRSAGARGAAAHGGLRFFERRLGLLSFALGCGILTLMAGMFFVLPRTARAAIGRFGSGRYHLPGFTREITLGEIGQIKQSSRPVMHVRTYGGEALNGVYWRGASLSQFDGVQWSSPPGRDTTLRVDHGTLILGRAPHLRPGRNVAYRVQLEEIAADTLFFAGTPEAININLPGVRISRGGSIHVPPLPNGIGYSVYSFIEDPSAPVQGGIAPLPDPMRQEALELPHLDPRIPALARTMTEGADTDEERARLLQQRLRHDYGYTLQLLNAPVADPLANFLFVRKKGHCEYFASAMAVMLRTLGIPSRVAVGFQSGVYNSITGWQVVRASDAHSWVEAWLPSSGWTTFDPTPSDPNAGSSEISGRLSMLADAADEFWQNWVLSYDLPHQSALASRIEESSRVLGLSRISSWVSAATAAVHGTPRSEAIWLLVVAGAAILAIPVWPALRALLRRRAGVRRLQRGEGQASDATLLYQRMLAVLERGGFRKPASLTPVEFARALPMSEMSILVEDLTAAYNEFRFGGRRDVAPRMVRLLERLEGLPRTGVESPRG